jgi:hypothetical protein
LHLIFVFSFHKIQSHPTHGLGYRLIDLKTTRVSVLAQRVLMVEPESEEVLSASSVSWIAGQVHTKDI